MKRIFLLTAVLFGCFNFVSAQAEYSLQPYLFLTAPQMDSCDVYDTLECLPDNQCFVAAVGERIYMAKRFIYVSPYCGDTVIAELHIRGNRSEPDYFFYSLTVFDTYKKRIGFSKDMLWFKNFKPYDKKFGTANGELIGYFRDVLRLSGIPWTKTGWKT